MAKKAGGLSMQFGGPIICVLLSVGGMSSGALAATEPIECSKDDAALRKLLGRRHSAPTREQIDALCVDGLQTLIAIGESDEGRAMERLRALWALGHYPERVGIAMLARVASDGEKRIAVRRTAFTALNTVSKKARGDVLNFVSRSLLELATAALYDQDPRLRLVAVDSLSGRPEGQALLESALAREKHVGVQKRLNQALKRSKAARP